MKLAIKDWCVTLFLVVEDGELWDQDSWSQKRKFEGDDWNFKGGLQD